MDPKKQAKTQRSDQAKAGRISLKAIAIVAMCVFKISAQQTAAPDPMAILASIASPPKVAQPAGAGNLFQRSEYSLQLTGLLDTNSNGDLTSNLTPNSLGFLLGMRIHLNPWEALEVELGATDSGQLYSAPPPIASTSAISTTQAEMLRLSVNEVITASTSGHLVPFLLAGGGVAEFEPKEKTQLTPDSQARAMATVGAGVDIRFFHLGVRAEIEGLFYKAPDFHNPTIPSAWTHVAQPSAGLIFSF